VLAARWIGMPASSGQHFLLDTGTLSVLGYYHDVPAVRVWNGPLSPWDRRSSVRMTP